MDIEKLIPINIYTDVEYEIYGVINSVDPVYTSKYMTIYVDSIKMRDKIIDYINSLQDADSAEELEELLYENSDLVFYEAPWRHSVHIKVDD